MSKIITRLYDNFAQAERTVLSLKAIGIDESDISIVSSHHPQDPAPAPVREPKDMTASQAAGADAAAGGSIGGLLGAGGGALTGLGLVAVPGLGPVVAAGWLAATALGAVVGGAVGASAGGIVGALSNSGVSEEEAEVYAEAVRRGSTLISVKVSDSDIVAVERELAKSDYVNVSERRADYLARGWTRFDVGARPYTPEEIAAERERRFERT